LPSLYLKLQLPTDAAHAREVLGGTQTVVLQCERGALRRDAGPLATSATQATLTFDLADPEARLALRRALEGERWCFVVHELIENFLRSVIKWSNDAAKVDHYAEVRDYLLAELREHHLSTDDDLL